MPLIATTGSGIGNRLKCVASAFRLDADSVIGWPKHLDKHVRGYEAGEAASLEELFANGRRYARPPGPRYAGVTLATWQWYATKAEADLYPVDQKLDFQFDLDRLPRSFIEAYTPIFQTVLKPSAAVLELASGVDLSGVEFGLHIRTFGEQTSLKNVANRNANMTLPLAVAADGRKKFVACDCDDTLRRLAELPNVVALKRPAGQSWLRGWQYALADIILLSRTPRIFCSTESTFVEAAFAYSGFQIQVHKWGEWR
jgi:hypothetical protein